MKRLFYIITICSFVVFDLNAEGISLSLNYFYIGAKEKYALHIPKRIDNHGVGIQGNFHLKNNFYLLADAGYYFDSHYKKDSSKDDYVAYVDSYLRCYAVNTGLAYRLNYANFYVLPYIGIGCFDEYSQQRFKSNGGSRPQPYPPIWGLVGPYDVIDKHHSTTITINIGLTLEYAITDKIFVTGGIKYMIDIYDFKYNAFPCLNAGLGYRF